ncbi:mitochondrial import receptor subunit TOM20 homolog B-like [Drosophila hydei]|uniref:Mitochondrial import receptor subunit TOM20 homolog B-like n=1 Tax=Drosophila hydei TaxID=7224 RepID=A0A6J1LHW6_DROHY|nr:mitochondrial import receptor subunit TOM20 homolog B-like [Drosophila hydei]
MFELSGQTVVFVGLAALALVSYCIYFDHKRRRDPQYKRRVHERRQRELSQCALRKPPLNAEVVEYFLRHVYLGETCVRSKDWDRAVHYFANAIMICADPHILLCKLKVAVPIELYDKIIAKVRLLVSTSENWGQPSTSIIDSLTSNEDRTLESTESLACSSEMNSD